VFAPTTEFRAFWDQLAGDVLAERTDRSVQAAIAGVRRASQPPWGPALDDALAASAQIATARAEGQRRIAEAQTRKGALIAESKGQVQALVAKASAEVNVQRARIAQVRFQLVADKVKPAEANKAKMIATARGVASKITEDGKATAIAIRSLGATWANAGDSARQIFVAQKLSRLVETMMSTVGEMPIDKLTVIDRELAANGSNFAVKAAITSEQLKQLLGIDLGATIQGLAGQRVAGTLPPAIPPPPRPRSPTQQGSAGKPPGPNG